MNRIILSLSVALLSIGLARPQEPARYTIETAEVQKIVGVMTFDIYCQNLKADEWQAFVPIAPELPGQTAVKTTMSPVGVAGREKSPLARPILIAKVPAKTPALQNTLPTQVTYQATLHSRELKSLPINAKTVRPQPLSAADSKMFLADYGDADYKADPFKKWLADSGLKRKPKEMDIDFARRTFLAIKNGFKYEYKFTMDRSASAVCQAGKSDCGGLSMLYVAGLRANQVPARARFGRWAKSAKPDEKVGTTLYFQWHVKAEFYAEGIGWVPVDLSQAIEHDKSAEGLKYFGVDAGDFITFHLDANYVVDVGAMGLQKFHSLQRPAWWATGNGTTNPAKETEGWVVKKQ